MRIRHHELRPTASFRAARTPGVDIWHVWADRPWGTNAELFQSLGPTEQARARNYNIAAAREQFVQARASLRLILAVLLDCEPREVQIVLEPDGKPRLNPPSFAFNVSHSQGLCLVAVADAPVGVDVEFHRPLSHRDSLVQRFFSDAERERFAALPEAVKDAAFFRGWTCKEALLKCTGRGLRDLHQCVVELDPRRPAKLIRYAGQQTETVQLQSWQPSYDYSAAVAIQLHHGPSSDSHSPKDSSNAAVRSSH